MPAGFNEHTALSYPHGGILFSASDTTSHLCFEIERHTLKTLLSQPAYTFSSVGALQEW